MPSTTVFKSDPSERQLKMRPRGRPSFAFDTPTSRKKSRRCFTIFDQTIAQSRFVDDEFCQWGDEEMRSLLWCVDIRNHADLRDRLGYTGKYQYISQFNVVCAYGVRCVAISMSDARPRSWAPPPRSRSLMEDYSCIMLSSVQLKVPRFKIKRCLQPC